MKKIKKIITIQRLKIVLVMVFTFLVVRNYTDRVFVANTPMIKPQVIARVKGFPSYLASLIPGRKPPSPIANLPEVKPPPNAVFKPAQTGVSVAEVPSENKRYYKIEKGTSVEVSSTTIIQANGTNKTIKVLTIR